MSEESSNMLGAWLLVRRELLDMASKMPRSEQEWFFDPRNRDQWMDSFIDHLKTRFQQPDRIASNE